MALKIVMGSKSGKSFQRDLSTNEAEAIYGKALGEEINGELLGYTGVKFKLTGGSDAQGFPMRVDLPGTGRKRILITKSTGFKGKIRNKRFGGLRIKKSVAGNTVNVKTHQLNLKILSGEKVIEKAFAPAEEPKSEEVPQKE
jgi:small subunit ribosomal protein S6e